MSSSEAGQAPEAEQEQGWECGDAEEAPVAGQAHPVLEHIPWEWVLVGDLVVLLAQLLAALASMSAAVLLEDIPWE